MRAKPSPLVLCSLALVASTTAWVAPTTPPRSPPRTPPRTLPRTLPPTTAAAGSRVAAGRRLFALQASAEVQFALFQEQQRALARTAEVETEWMGELPDLEPYSLMPPPEKKTEATLRKRSKQRAKKSGGGGKAKGFGGGAKKAAGPPLKPVSPEAAALGLAQAAVLEEHGVVRVNGALSPETCTALRAAVLEERDAAEAAVADGMPSSKRFGDLILSGNRRDVLLPLADSPGAPAVVAALEELFGPEGTLLGLYDTLVGERAVLYELASLISEPGACKQHIHTDMPYQKSCALYTGFLALQDIEPHMGPTTFVPRTHDAESHEKLSATDSAVREEFLASAGGRVALLRAGDIAIFDSRSLHAGGGNHAELGSTRALFYFSLTNPDTFKLEGTNLASMRPGYAAVPVELGDLRRGFSEDTPFAARGDGLGPEGDDLAVKRQAFRRQRNAPDGAL